MDRLTRTARERPDDIAIDEGRSQHTFRELDRSAEDMARRLVTAGAGRGGTVATLIDAQVDSITTVHAVPRTGAAVAPLSSALTDDELALALDGVRPSVFACDHANEGAARRAARDRSLELVIVGNEVDAHADQHRSELGHTAEALEPTRANDPLAVLWTSGTGGRPRGVALTHGNFRASAKAVQDRLGLGPGDRWYASLSMAHVGGLALVLRAVSLGSRIVTRGRFHPDAFNRLADEGSISHASLVPTMLYRILEARDDRPLPDSVLCVLVGGAHAPPALVERALAAGVPLALTYGMTEACSQVATAPPSLVRSKPGTVGEPLEGVGARIGRTGEIEVRGPTVARGYLGADEPIAGKDGWYRTGDLGRFDEHGHLWVTGRVADRIVTGGVNVDPGEVESALRRHPSVADVAVLGLPDAEWGERVVAAIVPHAGAPVTEAELLAFARSSLRSSLRPRLVRLLEALPYNRNGKADRARLAQLLLSQEAGA